MTAQKLSREDRLFCLATVCKQKGITPNNTAYMGTIIGVCAANFGLPKNKIKELAETLTAAYRSDHWTHILGEVPQATEVKAEIPLYLTQPKPKNTPKTDYQFLKQLAKKDTYDGVGRLILKEVQLTLGPVSTDEVISLWWNQNNSKDTITQEGNVLLIYWGGQDKVDSKRELRPVTWNPQRPVLEASAADTYPDVYEKEVMADNSVVGEVSEDN